MTRTPKAPPQPVTVPASTRQRHNQPLAQTRLASASAAVKSVRRHKTRTPPAADQQQQLRQAGLASFGFAVDTPATNTPTPAPAPAPSPPPPPQQQRRAKRRKRLPREEVEVEVPETQFGQSTQSPQFDTATTTNNNNNNNNNDDDDAYSSPLLSPPSLSSSPSSDVVGAVGSQASVSSRAAMPPPPVTPKRRKVLEIPDSKSPPVTPFSPWQPSQHQLGMQMLLSPTGRLGGSPVGGRVESGVDTGAAEEVVVGRTGRRLFAAGPKRAREEEEEEDTPRPRETEKEPPPEAAAAGPCAEAPAPAVNRDKIINSSQWWEVEEDAPLSTQVTNTQTQTQSRAGTDIDTQVSIATVLLTDSQKPAARRAQEQEQEQEQESGTETFRVDLTYNEPDTEDLEAPEPHDPPARAAAQDESQCSFHSMAAYPPPHPLRDDTLDAAATTTSAKHSLPLPKAPDTVVVDDTASEEDPDPDDEDAPHYKPYHTQQLPSSFWQTNGAYTQLLQQGSQWAPDALRRKYSAAGHPSSSQRAAAPEIVQLPGGAGGPMKDVDVGVEEDVDVDVDAKEDGDEDEDGDGDEPSQFLPGPGDDGEREGEPPSSPVLPGCPEVPATPTQKVGRGRRRRRRRSGEFKLRSIPDDDEDVTIATSQLLPSELMETFPMPPPLSQFSSYGYGDLSFESESETQ